MISLDAFCTHLVALGQWIVHASLSATGVAAAVFVLQLAFSRWLTPGWRYRMWALVVLRLMLPAVPVSHRDISNIDWITSAGHAFARHIAQAGDPASHPSAIRASSPNMSVVVTYAAPHSRDALTIADRTIETPTGGRPVVDLPRAAAVLWCCIVVVLLMRLIAANISLGRRLRVAVPVTDPSTLALLNDCRRVAGVLRPTPLLVTDVVRIPAAAGVWRPRILLPQGLFERLPADEQRAILLHELAHIRCRDVAINWLLAIVQILHWFNPFIWLAFSRLRADREIARDAMVLGSVEPGQSSIVPDQYADILLKLTESLASFPRDAAAAAGVAGIVSRQKHIRPGLFSSRSGLHRRLQMIARLPTPPRYSVLGPLLALILAAATFTRAEDPAPARQPDAPAHRILKEGEPPIEEQLDTTAAEIRFDATGFSDAIDFLRATTGANIFVNWKALKDVGVDRTTPITVHLRNVKYSKALTIILDDVGGTTKLGYRIEDNVLTISVARDFMQNIVVRVYDIRDLLVDVPDFDPKNANDPAPQKDPVSPREQRVAGVIRLIEDVVATDTWKDQGGLLGAIRELQGQLIVTQSPENQAAIVELLDQLRETHGIQVNVEARFISCSEALAEKFSADWEKAHAPATRPASAKEASPETRRSASADAFFLADSEVREFLRETSQSPDAALLTAPRLTLFNGQRAYVQVMSEHPYVGDYQTVRMPDGQIRYDPVRSKTDSGIILDVQATAAADRKSITLTLRPKVSVLLAMTQTAWPSRPAGSTLKIDEPRMKSSELQTTIRVPDNGTVVLGGMEDPGIGSGLDSAPSTRPADKPHFLFLLVKPNLILQREAVKVGPPLKTKLNP